MQIVSVIVCFNSGLFHSRERMSRKKLNFLIKYHDEGNELVWIGFQELGLMTCVCIVIHCQFCHHSNWMPSVSKVFKKNNHRGSKDFKKRTRGLGATSSTCVPQMMRSSGNEKQAWSEFEHPMAGPDHQLNLTS